MTTKRILAALAAGTLLFAACGGDDDAGGGGGESNAYSEALAGVIGADEEVPFSESQVTCLAGEFIGALGGPSALEDAGITPEDITDSEDISDLGLDVTDEQAAELAGAFKTCDISLSDLILEQAGDEIPDEVKECVADALDEDALADFFAQTVVNQDESGDDLPPEIMESMFACFGG